MLFYISNLYYYTGYISNPTTMCAKRGMNSVKIILASITYRFRMQNWPRRLKQRVVKSDSLLDSRVTHGPRFKGLIYVSLTHNQALIR